jgi:hypothetical protein
MKVDFLNQFTDFIRLTENHRIFLFQRHKDTITIRAGRFGFRINKEEEPGTFAEVEKWAVTNACNVVQSLPEELVFA